MPKRSDDLDNDHTDELPVLLETVALTDVGEPLLVTHLADDTAEHALQAAAAADAGSAELVAELAERAEQIPALEAQIRVLTDGTRDLERTLSDKDRLIAELRDTLTSQRRSNEEAVGAQSRAAAQLAIRDGRIAELTATVEQLETEAAAHAAALAQLRREAEAARRDTEALKSELTARPLGHVGAQDAEKLREDNAALAAYIAGRRTWWDEMQAMQTRLTARVAALEQELAEGARRFAAADELAARESRRAVTLRAELVDYARRAEALERELRLARSSIPATQPPSAVDKPETAPALVAPTKPARPEDAAPAAPPPDTPVLTDAVYPSLPAIEAAAQLEAEVEFKRQQVAAQLVELRDREQRLRAVTGELERARRDLAALRTELEESKSNVARLERAVADKDRALEARDARIATLHEELRQRPGGVEKRSPLDLPIQPTAAARAGAHDGAADGVSAPALICLTGDAPKRFALTKSSITVGRGPHCDLQILTHFVSREHARLTLSGGVALIEDLGSRNGVFVNSIRVDRRALRQGDLVTIGETQFRFVESMAH